MGKVWSLMTGIISGRFLHSLGEFDFVPEHRRVELSLVLEALQLSGILKEISR